MFETPLNVGETNWEYIVWCLDIGQKPEETAWYKVEIVTEDLNEALRYAIPLGHRAIITKRVRMDFQVTEKQS